MSQKLWHLLRFINDHEAIETAGDADRIFGKAHGIQRLFEIEKVRLTGGEGSRQGCLPHLPGTCEGHDRVIACGPLNALQKSPPKGRCHIYVVK